MRRERGQISVLFVLLIPVLFVLVALVVNYSVLIDSKIRLQIAADRAVFAGASKLAYIMNMVSEENWKIHRAYKDLVDNFNPNSQQSIDECKKKVKEMSGLQAEAQFGAMDELINAAYEEAENTAVSVAGANYKGAVYTTVFGLPGERLFEIRDKGDPGYSDDSQEFDSEGVKIRADVVCSNIEGAVFDPSDVSDFNNDRLLSVTYGDRNYVAVIAKLSADFVPPIAANIFKPFKIETSAAAQPYGGSIKRFGLLAGETETLSEARGEAQKLIEAGKPYWFRPALVPVYMAKAFAGIEEGFNEEIVYQ